ncbi:MAG: Fic family protein [Opitutaceae bacterium]|jgi:Fic family protein|nr:Fic family protein [Opitutaceae bacterium]
MQRGPTGEWRTVRIPEEDYRAFVPRNLPPVPAIAWDDSLLRLREEATLQLGKLDGVATLLPEPELFLYSYVRREAVLSSQIEGTQSSLSDLLAYENAAAPGVPLDDVTEVAAYVAALEHGLKRIRQDGFPLCLRLVREIHEVLLSRGRGSRLAPGVFRTTQNWIGGSRPGNAAYVPPPADEMMDCLGALEQFLHDQPVRTPALVKAALAHVQFETIHPFLDGNGRIGRLLITLILCAEGTLAEPLLYLSLFFKTHREHYYRLLQQVRTHGDWEAWLDFFFQGIFETSRSAVCTAHSLLKLFAEDRKRLSALPRAPGSLLQVQHALQRRPVAGAAWIGLETSLTQATVNKALAELIRLGIVRELTGGGRNRVFAYSAHLALLNEQTMTTT